MPKSEILLSVILVKAFEISVMNFVGFSIRWSDGIMSIFELL